MVGGAKIRKNKLRGEGSEMLSKNGSLETASKSGCTREPKRGKTRGNTHINVE